MIRLELNHSLMHYYTELDCIMLCGVRNRPALHDYPALRAEVARLHTPAPPEGNKHEELVPAGSQDEDHVVRGAHVGQHVDPVQGHLGGGQTQGQQFLNHLAA